MNVKVTLVDMKKKRASVRREKKEKEKQTG